MTTPPSPESSENISQLTPDPISVLSAAVAHLQDRIDKLEGKTYTFPKLTPTTLTPTTLKVRVGNTPILPEVVCANPPEKGQLDALVATATHHIVRSTLGFTPEVKVTVAYGDIEIERMVIRAGNYSCGPGRLSGQPVSHPVNVLLDMIHDELDKHRFARVVWNLWVYLSEDDKIHKCEGVEEILKVIKDSGMGLDEGYIDIGYHHEGQSYTLVSHHSSAYPVIAKGCTDLHWQVMQTLANNIKEKGDV